MSVIFGVISPIKGMLNWHYHPSVPNSTTLQWIPATTIVLYVSWHSSNCVWPFDSSTFLWLQKIIFLYLCLVLVNNKYKAIQSLHKVVNIVAPLSGLSGWRCSFCFSENFQKDHWPEHQLLWTGPSYHVPRHQQQDQLSLVLGHLAPVQTILKQPGSREKVHHFKYFQGYINVWLDSIMGHS